MAQAIKMVPNRGRKIRYTGLGVSRFRKRLVPTALPLPVDIPLGKTSQEVVPSPQVPVVSQPVVPLSVAVDLSPQTRKGSPSLPQITPPGSRRGSSSLPPAVQPGSRRGSNASIAKSAIIDKPAVTLVDLPVSRTSSPVPSSFPRKLSGSLPADPPSQETMTVKVNSPQVVMNWLATNLTRRSGTVPAVCLTDPIGPGRIWSWDLPLHSDDDPIQAQGICTETVSNGTLHINFYTTAARGLVGTVQFRVGVVLIRPTEILNSQTSQVFADSTIVEVQTPVERNTGYHYHCEVKLSLLIPTQSFLHLTIDRDTTIPQTFTAPVYILGLSLTR